MELRLDGLPSPEIWRASDIVRETGFRRIVTLRPRRGGGLYEGGEAERLELLKKVSDVADYVDLEHEAVHEHPGLVEELRSRGIKIISSKHFFDGPSTIEEARRIVSEDLKVSDIVKIVDAPERASEAMALLSLYSDKSLRGRLVAFSMGERWSLMRVLSVALGAPFTYAALPGRAVAPGQLSYDELAEALEVLFKSWPSSLS